LAQPEKTENQCLISLKNCDTRLVHCASVDFVNVKQGAIDSLMFNHFERRGFSWFGAVFSTLKSGNQIAGTDFVT
jgi:hypothetical protein